MFTWAEPQHSKHSFPLAWWIELKNQQSREQKCVGTSFSDTRHNTGSETCENRKEQVKQRITGGPILKRSALELTKKIVSEFSPDSRGERYFSSFSNHRRQIVGVSAERKKKRKMVKTGKHRAWRVEGPWDRNLHRDTKECYRKDIWNLFYCMHSIIQEVMCRYFYLFSCYSTEKYRQQHLQSHKKKKKFAKSTCSVRPMELSLLQVFCRSLLRGDSGTLIYPRKLSRM